MKNIKNINTFLNESMKEDEIDKILRNVYNQYKNDLTRTKLDDIRFLGFLEAILVCLEILKPGNKFDYEVKSKKFMGLIPYTSKETYNNFIIRKVEEYLNK